MARPITNGLSYFPHYVDNGTKMQVLKKKYGYTGSGIFFDLLCEIYKNDYFLDIENGTFNKIFFCVLNDIEINTFDEIVLFCCDVGLFDKSLYTKGIITSKKIQEQYFEVVNTSRKVIILNKEYLIINVDLKHLNNNKYAFKSINTHLSDKVNVKETKKKETKINKKINDVTKKQKDFCKANNINIDNFNKLEVANIIEKFLEDKKNNKYTEPIFDDVKVEDVGEVDLESLYKEKK